MSQYIETRKQIEELQAKLAGLREAELAPTVAEIKARIDAFGIRPEDLFTAAELGRTKAPSSKRVRLPPKYALDGHTWGGRGPVPKWYTQALASGKTPDKMLVRS
jgi:DNA-binding protein H-NS